MSLLTLEESRDQVKRNPKAYRRYHELMSKYGKIIIPEDECSSKICNELNQKIEKEILLIAMIEALDDKKRPQYYKKLDKLTSLRYGLKEENICSCIE